MEWVDSIFRNLFFELDKIIYGLISSVYSILLQLTRTTLFDQDIIHQFSERIYALVGIFMLFKVSISIINYILNPDDFSDKEKGMGSIIKHVLFSLALIVLVPYVFSEAYDLQAIILEENSIMNLVFGTPADRELELQGSNSSYAESAGQKIQFTIMYAFTQPNYNEFYGDGKHDLSSCSQTYAVDSNGYYDMRETPVFGSQASKESNFIYALNSSCWGTYNPDTDEYEGDGALLKAFNDANYGVVYQNYAQGVAQQSFTLFFRKDIILAKDSETDRFLVNYKYGISTAVGVATLYLLLMFCIDVAIRSIKLGFLQMIAPIPIISYCDPKSGKGGMFKKWVTMCGKTYADLFIRLFALYLGIYIISLLGTFKDIVTGEPTDFIVTSGSSWLFHIFLILGVLIFVKKLPDILKDSLGLEGGSFKDFKLNPLKRIEEEALGGKQLLAAPSAGLAGAGAFATNMIATKGNIFKKIGSGIAGGASATGRGLVGMARGEKFGKNLSNSYSGAMKARVNRADRKELGINGFEVTKNKLQQTMGIATAAEEQDSKIKRYDEAIEAGKAAKTRAESEVDKKADIIDTGGGVSLGALRDKVETLKNMNAVDYARNHGISEAQAVNEIARLSSEANSAYFTARKSIVEKYLKGAGSSSGIITGVNKVGGGTVFDTDVIAGENINKMTSAMSNYKLDGKAYVDGKIGDTVQSLEDKKTTIQSSDEYRTAHLVAEQSKKQK